MSDSASGFWSYAHSDNEATNGHIRELAGELANAYKLLTGDDLTLFMDRDEDNGLKWGDEWKKKISVSIAGTTFFIPIITPTYLKRPNCRDEFLEFWEKAKSSELGELLLPILYAPVDLSDETTDEICKIVKDIQSEDWTDTRLEERKSGKYRRALEKLAKRLAEIATEVQDKPEVINPTLDSEEGDEDDPAPGVIDRLAESEDAMQAAEEQIAKMGEALNKVGEAFSALPDLGPNASTAKRLSALKNLGKSLAEPAAEFKLTTADIESSFRSIGTGLEAIIEYSSERELSAEEIAEIRGTADAIAQLKSDITLDDELNEMRTTLRSMGKMSRDLRKPVSTMESGFRSLETAVNMVSRWDQEMSAFIAELPPR